jgi:hypothetical protein
MHKLGIVVPYRDRAKHLRAFVRGVKKFIFKYSPVDYCIIVVNQQDIKKFNRGKLLNIGFLEAERRGCDYVIFHDVDLIPTQGDYKYSNIPLQLANRFRQNTFGFSRTIQRDYFGGVTLFTVEDFRKINGYSNKYRGWGFEDNDLLFRCREQNIPLENIKFRTPKLNKPALKFNGKNSYVQIQNNLKFARPLTFTASFYPDKIFCDPNEITDEYTIFGIPGYDLNLSYNSFSTYKFELFLTNQVAVSITTKFTPNIPARVAVTVDPRNRKVEFFFNGSKVFDRKYMELDWQKSGIYRYGSEEHLYLGAAAPDRNNKPKFYKGFIDSFAVYKKLLSGTEIRNLFTNINDSLLTENIDQSEIKDSFYCYFDSRFIKDGKLEDLSGNNTYNILHNCSIENLETEDFVEIGMPTRRKCVYSLLPHKENGYEFGYWVDWSSRKNQLYYHSLVNANNSNLEQDGLSTCKYRELSVEENGDYIKLNVRT